MHPSYFFLNNSADPQSIDYSMLNYFAFCYFSKKSKRLI